MSIVNYTGRLPYAYILQSLLLMTQRPHLALGIPADCLSHSNLACVFFPNVDETPITGHISLLIHRQSPALHCDLGHQSIAEGTTAPDALTNEQDLRTNSRHRITGRTPASFRRQAHLAPSIATLYILHSPS